MDWIQKRLSRREALSHAGAAVGAFALTSCDQQPAPLKAKTMTRDTETMPTVFLPHGGGPWPFMDDAMFGGPGSYDRMAEYMRALKMTPPVTPKAILVLSAHWEEPVPTLQTAPAPPLYYDYQGFPPETYELQWPAPGAPDVASDVRDVLEAAGMKTAEHATRGFDHGVFVPLMLAYPAADVPTFQLSLKRGLDPADHFAMGQALAPLRERGLFIVGSGMSYHNMRAFMRNMRGGDGGSIGDDSRAFDEWLAETVALEPSKRQARLIEWERAPAARESHPREEHLLPLMVIAGAAAEDAGSLPYRDVIMGAHVSAAHFG